jgi:hypothetical protein
MHKRISYIQLVSITVFLLFLLSISASAQGDDLANFIWEIKNVVYEVVIILYCILLYIASSIAALLIILTGIKYMSSEDEEGRIDSKKRLTYSIIGLLVIALVCPMVNIFFSGSDIGIPDANGVKIPCQGCPFIWSFTGGVGPVVPPIPTPTPSVSPTPMASPTPTGYSSCDAACKDQKDGANAKYTGGTCVESCSVAGKETYRFDCTKEGKPAGNVCCCDKVVTVNPGEEGSICKHTEECNPGLYCSGGLVRQSDLNRCKKKLEIFGNCNAREEIDYVQKNICRPELFCFLGREGSGFDPKTCQPANCQLIFPNAKCCTAGQTCTGPMETADFKVADCKDRCCTECN